MPGSRRKLKSRGDPRCPCRSVSVVERAFGASFLIVLLALGPPACCGSTTLPVMEPAFVCALAVPEAAKAMNDKSMNRARDPLRQTQISTRIGNLHGHKTTRLTVCEMYPGKRLASIGGKPANRPRKVRRGTLGA